jgi:soluble lytic murein transglycosylase-like protein
MRLRRAWLTAIVATIIPLIVGVTLVLVFMHKRTRREIVLPPKPEAPPDLEKLRAQFASGLEALQRGNGPDAVRHLSSFDFKQRAVEEYRLYFLANGYQLAGDRKSARLTLAKLWERTPHLVYWENVAFNLGALYGSAADWNHATEIYDSIAARSETSSISGTARWQATNANFIRGDIAGLFHAARDMAIKNPRAPQVADAISIVRTLSGQGPNDALKITPAERLERAVSLMRDGDLQDALNELNALQASGVPADLRQPVQLNRGLALNQLRRFEESNKVLEPLASASYKIAIPAIYNASKNYRLLAASINPITNKVMMVRQRVGTVRVHVKGKKKPVLRPKFANVRKTIQLVDLAKKAKKETDDRLATERLKDLLSLPLADPVRIEVLNTLIAIAESKNQDDYERQLVADLAKIDPSQEAGLQHFWDKAWTAYSRGDLNGAVDLFAFIRVVYRNPNLKRQADYWRARAVERLGKAEEAAATYRALAAAPYADLYALHSQAHGAPHRDADINPLKTQRPDWQEIAEKNMPNELRLAYELTALWDARDARLEIQKNLKRSNDRYASALLADLYNSTGDTLLMMRSLRRAFPEIATVEQDSVPTYFLRIYYPVKYQDAIIKYSRQNNLDPYLMMGLIHQESFFNPAARSPVGAVGLMQLMPPTAKELARQIHSSSKVDDPEVNIRLGMYYFRQLINMFGGAVQLAVASYNAGQGNVIRWRRAAPRKPMDEFIESIPFTETRNYVKRVTMLSASYRRLTL